MFSLTLYSYRNLWVRRLTTVLTAGGMGLVIFVFSAVLMLAEGLEKALVSTGSKENVVFIRRSSEAEVQSILPREQAAIIETLPEIEVDGEGRKRAARETVVLISLLKKDTGSLANVTVRGGKPDMSLDLRPQVKVSAGRMYRPGTSEVVVGKSLAERFSVSGLGQNLDFGSRTWTVVGIMDAGGTGFDSEIWCDADILMAAFRRPVYSSVIAKMRDSTNFTPMKDRVLADPRLTVQPWREREYYAAQSELMARFIRILGVTLTLIFSQGAIIGSMVTMYSAVAVRTAEIGTLRALGFRRRTILTAFLLESVFLSLLGGLLGLFAASFMSRFTVSTLNWQTFSELSFRFALTPAIALNAIVFAVVMGLLGGALPSVRAARMEIVAALRLQ